MSLTVETYRVGQLDTNCYLLIDSETDRAIVVDPGDDSELIIQKILDNRVTLEAVIATHGHFDHILGVQEIKLAFNVPFLIHSKDLFLLERMRQTAQKFVGFDPGPAPKPDELLDGASVFGFGSVNLKLFFTPGHTPGSVSFYDDKNHHLFVGDVVFADGQIGRTDFSYCSTSALLASIKLLFALPDQTQVFSGHGRSFYLADEKINHRV